MPYSVTSDSTLSKFPKFNMGHDTVFEDYFESSQPAKYVRSFWDNPVESNAVRVHDKLYTAFIYWKSSFNPMEIEKLTAAYNEASSLVLSGLFGTEMVPNIGIDSCGEIIISHRSATGYVDIGCRGEKELSFHVRNDVDPTKTAYGDIEFDGSTLPEALVESIREIA